MQYRLLYDLSTIIKLLATNIVQCDLSPYNSTTVAERVMTIRNICLHIQQLRLVRMFPNGLGNMFHLVYL